jgi:hypothetical protein
MPLNSAPKVFNRDHPPMFVVAAAKRSRVGAFQDLLQIANPSRSQHRILMRSRSRLAKTTKCPARASGWRCSRTSACLIAAQAVLLGTHQGAVRGLGLSRISGNRDG